jgi:hypothetical protein
VDSISTIYARSPPSLDRGIRRQLDQHDLRPFDAARGCGLKGEEVEATVRRSGNRGFAETIDLKLKLEPPLAATLAVSGEEVADGLIAAEPVSSPGG